MSLAQLNAPEELTLISLAGSTSKMSNVDKDQFENVSSLERRYFLGTGFLAFGQNINSFLKTFCC